MELENFIKFNEVEYTRDIISEKELQELSSKIGVEFGVQLKEYILKYGYLAFEDVEMYGINSRQNEESDMIKQTKYLHEWFEKTIGLIAIENQGDGDYYFVDKEDNVYRYNLDLKEPMAQNIKLFDYILKRFEEAKQNIES